MSPLRQALADYLRIRRALGYKLARAEKLLAQYLDHLDRLDEQTVTVENAVAWVTQSAGDVNWWAFRISAVRGFAGYLHALDPVHEVPPKDLLPRQSRRTTPYLYSDQEIQALMAATSSLRFELRQATYRTVIGLLSVTGMRVGEAIRLDNGDVDLRHGVLTVRDTKFSKTRELPLHHSTAGAMRSYLRLRVATSRRGSATRFSSRRPAPGCSIAMSATRSLRSSSAQASNRDRPAAAQRCTACATASRCARCSSGIAPGWRSSRGCRCSPHISGMCIPKTAIGI